jgi:hypothetical protein
MKNYVKTIICLFALTTLTAPSGFAQILPNVQSSFNQYTLNNLQEKLFVHTDKTAYTAGGLIWFKIYDVNAANHQPMDLSKVVYVEILDNNQNPVMQVKIGMKNGSGSGSIYIPVTLTSGNFLLRAYTSWMKNFSPEYYFHKKLVIINPLRSPDPLAKTIAPPVYDIQFFPEGGNLVNGITSVVGFKATDQFGKGVDFKGVVLDKNNDTVARFEPLKFGIGHFQFKPDNSTAYRAIIKIAGKTIQKDLPEINANGYVMNVKDNGSGNLTITVGTNLSAGNVYLFAHTRGAIKAVETADITNRIAQFNINKNQLGDGISQLTIFNADKQPVCERLYFNRPSKKLMIAAAADQEQYNTRRKVNIAIDAKDEGNNPVVADLSLSVYKIDSLQHPDQDDIQNYLLLASDLKGSIESPGYYFKNTGAEVDAAIDNLMLTQGWRRFDWKDVLQNKTPAFNFLPEYNGPIITGHLISQLTNAPVKDIMTYLAIPGKRVQMYTSSSDSLGRLLYNMKDFYGPGEIVVETNSLIDSNYHIDILSPFSEQYANITLPRLTLSPGLQNAIEEKNLDVQVQNIYNGKKIRQFYEPDVDSSAFFGTPYKTYLLDNYTRFTTMEEVMREYVSEVNIVLSKSHFRIKVLSDNGFLGEQQPMVLIDGVPFFDVDKLFAIDPLKVYKLEDVPYNYYWGPSFEAGIFSYTTYKGDLGGTEIDPHAVVMDYEGLEVQRQFYSPVYDTEQAQNSRIPDFRDVLFWEPYITTQTQGKNNLSFYTSDKTGQYIGIIQGLTATGEAGSSSFMFNVVK